MTMIRLDYVWLDGNQPTANIRTKAQMLELSSFDGSVDDVPAWGFDGSSTNQAEGHDSDCILQPGRVYENPLYENGYLVLCEVLNRDGSRHETNYRALIDDEAGAEFWFGFEQEYVLMSSNGRPLGFPDGGYPEPQGPYYCAVGSHNVAGRELIDEHFATCVAAGIGVSGINAEVMLGQWEFQCFGKGAKRAGDDLIMARFMLYLLSEKYDVIANTDPKPISGDWNGSGLHSNFSFDYIRDVGGQEYIEALCQGFEPFHKDHLAVYGAGPPAPGCSRIAIRSRALRTRERGGFPPPRSCWRAKRSSHSPIWLWSSRSTSHWDCLESRLGGAKPRPALLECRRP